METVFTNDKTTLTRRSLFRAFGTAGAAAPLFAPGHAMTALWNPEYEKMQKNAVKWLLHQT